MKSILLHIHEDAGQESRLQAALDLARANGGHISCIQVTPYEYFSGGDPFGGVYVYADAIDAVRAVEREARAKLEARLAGEGVSWDWRKSDGNIIQTLIDQSRLMDVVVLSQPSTANENERQTLGIGGDIAIHARAPVLSVAANARGLDVSGNAMVAWNGSGEAANALRHSVALLRLAATVHIVEVSDDKRGVLSIEASAYLARHGVASELHEWPAKGRKVDVALLHAAVELDAAYMVLGAYGHSRLRETILGGVTRDLLRSAHLPLLLAH